MGIYHYNIKGHHLEELSFVESNTTSLSTYPFAYDAAIFVFITAIFERTMRKYRERGYRFAMLDAGILLHSFYLVSEVLNMGCCAIGSPFDTSIEDMLDIRDSDEAFVASLVIGPVKK